MRRILFTLALATCAGALGCSKAQSPEANKPAPAAEAPSPPAAPAAAPVAAGPKASGQGFTIEAQPPASAAVGAESVVQVVLAPTGGFHVNKDFPTSLEIKAPAGVTVAKAKLAPADAAKFAEDGAAFEVRFTPTEAGEKKFEALFKFAVCTETTCDPKREALAWSVNVK